MKTSRDILEPVVYRWGWAQKSGAGWDEVIAMCHGAGLAVQQFDPEIADDYHDLVLIATILRSESRA